MNVFVLPDEVIPGPCPVCGGRITDTAELLFHYTVCPRHATREQKTSTPPVVAEVAR